MFLRGDGFGGMILEYLGFLNIDVWFFLVSDLYRSRRSSWYIRLGLIYEFFTFFTFRNWGTVSCEWLRFGVDRILIREFLNLKFFIFPLCGNFDRVCGLVWWKDTWVFGFFGDLYLGFC